MDNITLVIILAVIAFLDFSIVFNWRVQSRMSWSLNLVKGEDHRSDQGEELALWEPNMRLEGAFLLFGFNLFISGILFFTTAWEVVALNIIWLIVLVLWAYFAWKHTRQPFGSAFLVDNEGLTMRMYDRGEVVTKKVAWSSVDSVKLLYGGGDSVYLEGIRMHNGINEIDIPLYMVNFGRFCGLLLEIGMGNKMDDTTRKFIKKQAKLTQKMLPKE